MSQTIEIRWAQPPKPRSKPIPPEMWEEHKAELGQLYLDQGMKLELLMAFMVDKFGFAPSHRQYTHQFQKWGFYKYNTLASSSKTAVPTTNHYTIYQATDDPSDASKRQRSAQSLHSVDDSNAQLLTPPKKRLKTNTSTANASDSTNLRLQFSSNNSLGREVQNDRTEVQEEESDKDMTMDQTLSSEVNSEQDSNTLTSSDISQTNVTVFSTSDSSITTQSKGKQSASFSSFDTVDPTLWRNHWNPSSSPLISYAERMKETNFFLVEPVRRPEGVSDLIQFNPLIPLSPDLGASAFLLQVISLVSQSMERPNQSCTITAEDMERLEEAAYCFCWLYRGREAGVIYHTLLTILLAPSFVDNVPRHFKAILHCNLRRQPDKTNRLREKLQAFLQKVKDEFSQCMIHMQLATIYEQQGAVKEIEKQLRSARGCLDACTGSLIKHLPDDTRILDFLACKTQLRLQSSALTVSEAIHWVQSGSGQARAALHSSASELLKRIPGPFEIQNDALQNPCLKSCVKWCQKELEPLNAMPHTDDKFATARELSDALFFEHARIFVFLWSRLQKMVYEDDQVAEIWISSRTLMGLLPAELLELVCFTAFRLSSDPSVSASNDDKSSVTNSVISIIRNDFTALNDLPDERLAEKLVESYVLYNSWFFLEDLNVQQQLSEMLEAMCESFWQNPPPFLNRILEPQMEAALKAFEPLRVGPSRSSVITSEPTLESLQAGPSELMSTMLPTLAPSLSSLSSADHKSFRRLKERIGQLFQNNSQSSISQPSSRRNRSVLSISDLSNSFRESMSLRQAESATASIVGITLAGEVGTVSDLDVSVDASDSTSEFEAQGQMR